MSPTQFLEDLKAELIEGGRVTPDLFTYIDDRINQHLAEQVSKAVAEMEERLREELGRPL